MESVRTVNFLLISVLGNTYALKNHTAFPSMQVNAISELKQATIHILILGEHIAFETTLERVNEHAVASLGKRLRGGLAIVSTSNYIVTTGC